MKRRTFVRSSLATVAATAFPRPRSLFGQFREATSSPPDVRAVTGDGHEVTLTSGAIADLAARLRGRILLAGDDGYESARQVLNPSFDKHPALIARVTGVADIRAAVDFARDNGGLLLAVKCGGHSASGKSTCDRGMMIDLSPFRDVRVDPAARTARVTGGSLLGQLDHESMSFDLVTPMGTVSHTGVGGLVTGGGFGRVARRFGLSIDNLLSVDVVTADGRLVHASASENPELFWGVRGGGGNFGIVSSFEFRLNPMPRRVLGGAIMFPIAKARDVLRVFGDYGPVAPDELQLDLVMSQGPGDGPGVAGFGVCYSGAPAGAARALAPVRAIGTPIMDGVQGMDYVALQRSGDIDDPRALASYLKSGFVREISDELADRIVRGFEPHPSRGTQVIFQHAGGAISRVPSGATAFPQRDALGNMLGSVGWAYGSDPEPHMSWCRSYWETLEPFTHGFYSNDGDPDASQQALRENYRQNLQRMVDVKSRWDPTNLFRLNANVQPTVRGGGGPS